MLFMLHSMALPVQPANTSSSHKGRHVLSCRLRSQTAGFASGEGASLRHSADHHLQVSQGFMNIVQIVSEKTMSCRFRVLWRLGQAVHFLAPNGVGAQQPCLVMCVQDAGKEGPGPDSTNPGQKAPLPTDEDGNPKVGKVRTPPCCA